MRVIGAKLVAIFRECGVWTSLLLIVIRVTILEQIKHLTLAGNDGEGERRYWRLISFLSSAISEKKRFYIFSEANPSYLFVDLPPIRPRNIATVIERAQVLRS